MNSYKVGVVGAGRMGMALVKHLRRNKVATLVYDVTDERLADVESLDATWCHDLSELAAAVDLALVCVGFESQVDEVLLHRGGILVAAPAGSMVAIISTIAPEAMEPYVAAGLKRNITVFDAPVCRGGQAADDGALLTLVGGSAEVFEKFQPIADCYSSDVVHIGRTGSGQVAKAANNLILWACLVADHEALALAARFGVDTEVLRGALLVSSAENGALSDWGNQTMAWAQDDMVIVSAMADSVGISLPQAGLNREICRTLKPRRYDLDQYGI